MLALAMFASTALVRAQAPSEISNLPDGSTVIAYLNQAIEWHRHVLAEAQIATDPADVLFLNDARQISNQVLQLAFDFAKADAEMLAKQQSTSPTAAEGQQPNQEESLAQLATSAAADVRQRQADVESLKEQVGKAGGAKRRQLESQLEAMQSELELEQARSDTLRQIVQFAGGQGTAQGNLLGQIEELRRSVPELESASSNASQTAARTTASSGSSITSRQKPSGIVAVVEGLFALGGKMNTLDDSIRFTDALSQTTGKLRKPLVSALTAMVQQGDQAIRQSTATGEQKQRLDALTAQFKQVSLLVLPLSKQAVLLDAYKSNLRRWNSTVASEYDLELKRLAVRLAILAIVVALVITLAEIWRKAIFRYVHDVRRRYQFLLLRRILIWVAIAIAIAFALASEMGSIATFVGLITAGVAVALQNVIMAIAGYFFLIGKYGVRVGDRVQIGGVTGDVIDIGLVRLHLMEVGSADTGRQPTGRVVVFSNSVVFQPGASFYKQIPGTNFAWHQVSLTLAPNSDHRLAEQRMMEAVESVYANYREHIERQHQQMQETLNFNVALPKPQSRLHFTDGGLEILIRYPTDLQNASEIDDQVTRQVLSAIKESPKLQLVGSGTPNIQPVNEEPK